MILRQIVENRACLFFLIGSLAGYFYHQQAQYYALTQIEPALNFRIAMICGLLFCFSQWLKPNDPLILLLFMVMLLSTIFIDYYTMSLFKNSLYGYGLLLVIVSTQPLIISVLVWLCFWLFNGCYYLVNKLIPIGSGDIDLLAFISCVLNIEALLLAIFIAALSAGIVGSYTKLKKLPFVPFIALGSWVTYTYKG